MPKQCANGCRNFNISFSLNQITPSNNDKKRKWISNREEQSWKSIFEELAFNGCKEHRAQRLERFMNTEVAKNIQDKVINSS